MNIRRRLQHLLARALAAISPKPDNRAANEIAAGVIARAAERERFADFRAAYLERCSELIEAKQMGGSGPWLSMEAREAISTGDVTAKKLKEASDPMHLIEAGPQFAAGAFGDIDLALQNVAWVREINLSWLEFSRWGIQQIILISRLYYIKNPIIRRLIDISSTYVFGRGVEVSTDDEDANAVLKDFFDRNKKTLGQIALVELEKRKYYDGNLFWIFFQDAENTGETNTRTIDATEISDIICDPNDADTPWYYRRGWDQRVFDTTTGATRLDHMDAYYPALGYVPDDQPVTIAGRPVNWSTPVLHRKCGGVAKWHFGCPIIYPALDWAKSAKDYLTNCATIARALSQFAMTLTTKGGQQAIMGAKMQLGTTVGPGTQLYDTNPPTTAGGIFASGPGTSLEAFKTTGAGQDPEKVRQMKLQCCMVVGVPETFLADVSTGNLATATTLDRPTELNFAEKQEAWREDLTTIAQYVLLNSLNASGGKLREAVAEKRGHAVAPKSVVVMERARRMSADGKRMEYVKEDAPGKNAPIQITVTFPAIREGDTPAMVKAIVEAMTLDNKGGQIVGIDAKVGVGLLYEQLDVEDSKTILVAQYPPDEYDPDRTTEPLPAPIQKAMPDPGGAPQLPDGKDPAPPQQKAQESLGRLAAKLTDIGERMLSNGNNQ